MIEARIGNIVSINNDFPILRACVEVPGSGNVEEVVLWNPWGDNCYPSLGSKCLIFVMNGEFAQKYGLPFNAKDASSVAQNEKLIYTSTGTKIHLKQDGGIDIDALNDNTNPSINISASNAVNIMVNTNITGDCNVSEVYKVDNVQVVGNQQPAIPDPTVGLPEVHAAVDAILIALRNHGLIAI